MNSKAAKALIWSNTAKGWFKNEHEIVWKFNNFKEDPDAQSWLNIMGYNYKHIKFLYAVQIPTRINAKKSLELWATEEKIVDTQKFKKADIQVQLEILIEDTLWRENISLKKADKNSNFNQIDKRPVNVYQSMWGFNETVARWLKKFTWAIIPTSTESNNLRDKRRWYLDELLENERIEILNFFSENKVQIFNDILQGRWALSAQWFLVTRKHSDGNIDWVLKDITYVANFYSKWPICISKRWGLIIWRITAQRKGGTPDPTSLQFKISPLDLFEE